jgi:hypothetical protein
MVFHANTFFSEVDRHVTSPMVRLGYHRLPPSTGISSAPALLVSQTRWRRTLPSLRSNRWTRQRGEPVLAVGYEATDEDVARQLDPDDPATFEELWISYYPSPGRLELSSWTELLTGHADWDADDDGASSSDAELQRRIRLCGEAVESYNRRHPTNGGQPTG